MITCTADIMTHTLLLRTPEVAREPRIDIGAHGRGFAHCEAPHLEKLVFFLFKSQVALTKYRSHITQGAV
jgi:hypothetical protein